MNKYFFLTRSVITSIVISSCVHKSFIKEGIVYHYTHFTNIEDSARLPYKLSRLEDKIWFKDSCVVLERKAIHTDEKVTTTGTIRKITYDLYKYTYLDLRTFKCQDYYNLSDTALPFCNYYLKKNEALNWNFYTKNDVTENPDSLKSMPDTIIQNKIFKRLKILRIFEQFGDEAIFFLDCNAKKSIFHLSKTVDEKFPNCKVSRMEVLADLKSPLKEIDEINFIKERLSVQEKKIFKTWAKNALETKLPLLEYNKVFKTCDALLIQAKTTTPNKIN